MVILPQMCVAFYVPRPKGKAAASHICIRLLGLVLVNTPICKLVAGLLLLPGAS